LRPSAIAYQERLERICRTLAQAASPVHARLVEIARTAYELADYRAESEPHVRIETLLATGRRVLAAWLELAAERPAEAESLAREILGQSDAAELDQLVCYQSLARHFPETVRFDTADIGYVDVTPEMVVGAVVRYAAAPGFRLQRMSRST
jgi:hypothetical protein